MMESKQGREGRILKVTDQQRKWHLKKKRGGLFQASSERRFIMCYLVLLSKYPGRIRCSVKTTPASQSSVLSLFSFLYQKSFQVLTQTPSLPRRFHGNLLRALIHMSSLPRAEARSNPHKTTSSPDDCVKPVSPPDLSVSQNL